MSGWENFAAAQVGAAATLAGLIFVGVQVHLRAFQTYRDLQPRLIQAIAGLMAVLLECSLLLVPGQSPPTSGAETSALGVGPFLSVVGLGLFIIEAVLGFVIVKVDALRRPYVYGFIFELLCVLAAAIAFIVCGAAAGSGNATLLRYALVLGILLCYLVAVLDARIFVVSVIDPRPADAGDHPRA